MKPIYAIVSVFALLLLSVAAWAKPPTLEPLSVDKITEEVHPGQAKTFDLVYKQSEGDLPKSLTMVVQTPSGSVPIQATVPSGGDPVKGIPVSWSYAPQSSGPYRVHFEATSRTGDYVREPASPTEDFGFVSVSLVNQIIVCVIGALISLLFLPFVSYIATRAVNKRGDPAAAARISLLIGIVASLALIISVFSVPNFQYVWLVWALGAILVIGVLVGLFSRRRAI